ncbi:hypothetical protein DRJ17_03935 [Candidatus Woesearchaeota archaeon]|nr:MAG: hypothetical protein DRJ17_03935 [Candidatus Woesearchaeota archaeon]
MILLSLEAKVNQEAAKTLFAVPEILHLEFALNDTPFNTQILGMFNSKGGCGKSLVIQNTAIECSEFPSHKWCARIDNFNSLSHGEYTLEYEIEYKFGCEKKNVLKRRQTIKIINGQMQVIGYEGRVLPMMEKIPTVEKWSSSFLNQNTLYNRLILKGKDGRVLKLHNYSIKGINYTLYNKNNCVVSSGKFEEKEPEDLIIDLDFAMGAAEQQLKGMKQGGLKNPLIYRKDSKKLVDLLLKKDFRGFFQTIQKHYNPIKFTNKPIPPAKVGHTYDNVTVITTKPDVSLMHDPQFVQYIKKIIQGIADTGYFDRIHIDTAANFSPLHAEVQEITDKTLVSASFEPVDMYGGYNYFQEVLSYHALKSLPSIGRIAAIAYDFTKDQLKKQFESELKKETMNIVEKSLNKHSRYAKQRMKDVENFLNKDISNIRPDVAQDIDYNMRDVFRQIFFKYVHEKNNFIQDELSLDTIEKDLKSVSAFELNNDQVRAALKNRKLTEPEIERLVSSDSFKNMLGIDGMTDEDIRMEYIKRDLTLKEIELFVKHEPLRKILYLPCFDFRSYALRLGEAITDYLVNQYAKNDNSLYKVAFEVKESIKSIDCLDHGVLNNLSLKDDEDTVAYFGLIEHYKQAFKNIHLFRTTKPELQELCADFQSIISSIRQTLIEDIRKRKQTDIGLDLVNQILAIHTTNNKIHEEYGKKEVLIDVRDNNTGKIESRRYPLTHKIYDDLRGIFPLKHVISAMSACDVYAKENLIPSNIHPAIVPEFNRRKAGADDYKLVINMEPTSKMSERVSSILGDDEVIAAEAEVHKVQVPTKELLYDRAMFFKYLVWRAFGLNGQCIGSIPIDPHVPTICKEKGYARTCLSGYGPTFTDRMKLVAAGVKYDLNSHDYFCTVTCLNDSSGIGNINIAQKALKLFRIKTDKKKIDLSVVGKIDIHTPVK